MPHAWPALLPRAPRVPLPTRGSFRLSHPQLPQCLCIHLQRLSWSSHGTPLKRHEHVQFSEFLMMDIYKYHLLGHKPVHRGPELHEEAGPALELQDGPAAPKPGACPRGPRSWNLRVPCATRARLTRRLLKFLRTAGLGVGEERFCKRGLNDTVMRCLVFKNSLTNEKL